VKNYNLKLLMLDCKVTPMSSSRYDNPRPSYGGGPRQALVFSCLEHIYELHGKKKSTTQEKNKEKAKQKDKEMKQKQKEKKEKEKAKEKVKEKEKEKEKEPHCKTPSASYSTFQTQNRMKNHRLRDSRTQPPCSQHTQAQRGFGLNPGCIR